MPAFGLEPRADTLRVSPAKRLPGVANGQPIDVGQVWVVVTTLIVISVRDVRDFRLEPIDPAEAELAPAIAAS